MYKALVLCLILGLTAASIPQASPGECKICEMVFTYLEQELASNSSVTEVEKVLDKVCSGFGGFTGPCQAFVAKYTPVLVDYIESGLNITSACIHLRLCPASSNNQQAVPLSLTNVNMASVIQTPLGENKCTWGISYFCSSVEAATECNTLTSCQKFVWNATAPSAAMLNVVRRSAPVNVGSNPCTWGPTYWCASPNSANECSATAYCQEYFWSKLSRRSVSPLGSDQCTYGPSFWCASVNNANECNALAHCQQYVWKQATPPSTTTTTTPLGSNKCTEGPSYWCITSDNAAECQATTYCSQFFWNGASAPPSANTRSRRSANPVLGQNKCLWGPSYWCSSIDTANECNALAHCQEYIWKAAAPPAAETVARRSVPLGTNPCTFGPSFWCSNMEAATKCNAIAHCQEFVWKAATPSATQN